jgi:PAS domain S-box-containing protein
MTPPKLEDLARALFEEAGDALFLFDPDTDQLLDVNPMAVRLTGLGRADLLRLPATSLFRLEQAPAHAKDQRLRRASQETGIFHSQEGFSLRTGRDGVWLPVNLTITRLHVPPKPLGLITARDVREHREAHAALLHERHLLRTLMDNVPDHIYFKDAQGGFTRINKAMAALFGLGDPAQALGKTDFDFFSAEHARQGRDDEQSVMRTGRPVVGKEEKETWASGSESWVSTTKAPLRDPHGQVIGTFGISRDITERKRAERRLATQHTVTRVLAESPALGDALPRSLQAVCEGLGWQVGAMWQVDGGGQGSGVRDQESGKKTAGEERPGPQSTVLSAQSASPGVLRLAHFWRCTPGEAD